MWYSRAHARPQLQVTEENMCMRDSGLRGHRRPHRCGSPRCAAGVRGDRSPDSAERYDPCMSDEEVREAADKIVDRERLLEGEDPDTTNRAEAVHWLWIYGELLGFKRDVTDTALTRGSGLPQAALEEVDTDLTLLEAERRRLEQRYRFWTARVEELSSRAG